MNVPPHTTNVNMLGYMSKWSVNWHMLYKTYNNAGCPIAVSDKLLHIVRY